jgi:hypothetical protein
MAAAYAPVTPQGDQQGRGPPPERLVSKLPCHGVMHSAFLAAAPTLVGRLRWSVVIVSLLVAAVIAFAAATIDDPIVVAALFTAGHVTGRPRPITIIAGQYAGFALIVGISLTAATRLQAVPDQWVGLTPSSQQTATFLQLRDRMLLCVLAAQVGGFMAEFRDTPGRPGYQVSVRSFAR